MVETGSMRYCIRYIMSPNEESRSREHALVRYAQTRPLSEDGVAVAIVQVGTVK